MSQTGVPDRRLHGIPFLQQHLDERGSDVPGASGNAGLLLAAARRHGRSPSSPHFSLLTSRAESPGKEGSLARSPELSGAEMQSAVGRDGAGHVLLP